MGKTLSLAKKLVRGSSVEAGKLPPCMHIETTSSCNLDCEYCVLSTNQTEKTVMSLEKFKSLKKYFKDAKNISLSGMAEPLINKNIVEFIRIIKEESPGCAVSIFSNARLLTRELSEELIDVGLDKFEFSLDGVDPVLVDSIRKGGDLAADIENIRVLGECKKRRSDGKPVLIATTVLQRKNYRQLPEIVRCAAELGVERLNVNGMEPYTEDMVSSVLWTPGEVPEDLPEVMEQAIKASRECGLKLGLASLVPKSAECRAVVNPIILANGDVTPCSVLAYERDFYFRLDDGLRPVPARGKCKRLIFGNAFKTPLDELWYRKEFVDFRDAVLSGKFPGACESCMIKNQFICVRADFSPEAVLKEARRLTNAN